MAATDFRDTSIKEGKQAEFLVYESFPWELVEQIGVLDASNRQKVETALQKAADPHEPQVSVRRNWYY